MAHFQVCDWETDRQCLDCEWLCDVCVSFTNRCHAEVTEELNWRIFL